MLFPVLEDEPQYDEEAPRCGWRCDERGKPIHRTYGEHPKDREVRSGSKTALKEGLVDVRSQSEYGSPDNVRLVL
jgi:hypothetical protein